MSQLKDMQTLAPEYVKFLLGGSGARASTNGNGALSRKRNVASADSPAARLDRILKA
ncbi:MAG: hypothetical protein ACLPYS_18695 [Vulcanimicrobiaceae bacterium]